MGQTNASLDSKKIQKHLAGQGEWAKRWQATFILTAFISQRPIAADSSALPKQYLCQSGAEPGPEGPGVTLNALLVLPARAAKMFCMAFGADCPQAPEHTAPPGWMFPVRE